MFTFDTALPESVNIPSSAIKKVIEYLDSKEIPMHSLLIMRNDKLVFEKYYAPYKKETLHRLFSISKTCTCLATELLAEEGRIDLDTSITEYFPEYTNENTHRWIKDTTIRNMLEMRTCHAASTYKVDMKTNWVESFFTVAPTHKPGTIFHYDTSASHVLCALVEKTTGMTMLDYLKKKAFGYMDFSEDSYMVKDPFGVSMGGSGLMATPLDFLKLLYLIDKKGTIVCNDGVARTLISKEFLDKATTNISDTIMTAPVPSEAQGYGMQIWQNEKGGYVLYGMGGQFGISLPDKNLLIITTADTQGIQGGNQVIYNAFYDILLPKLDSDTTTSKCYSDIEHGNICSEYDELTEYCQNLSIALPRLPENYDYTKVAPDTQKWPEFASKSYILDDNKHGYKTLKINLSREGVSSLIFTRDNNGTDENLAVNFGFCKMQDGLFPIRNNEYTAGAVWLRKNVLYIKVHLIGESVGSIRIEIYFGDDDIVVFMKKIEETYFQEFDGHLYGKLLNE